MKLKKIALLSLATLMIASAFTGCAKKTDAERVSREVLQTPVTTPDNTDNNTIEYKEQFYFQNAESGDEYFIGFTEDKYFLTVVCDRNGYVADVEQSSGDYTVDSDGNYIIYDFGYTENRVYFLDNMVTQGIYGAQLDPVVLFNTGGVYVNQYGGMIFVDTDSSKGKFLWFGLEHGKYDMVLTKGQQKPESIEVYLIDGATGIGEPITLTAENFTEFDTSSVGETNVTVKYNNVEYNLSCQVYEDGQYTPPKDPFEYKYKVLNMTDEAYNALPGYITPNTTYEEFFANYKGDAAVFCYQENGADVTVSLDNITVDGWNPKDVNSTDMMHYRVKFVKDGITYVYIDWVTVCEEGDEEQGWLAHPKHNNEKITEKDGIWYVPKGTALDGITADFCPFTKKPDERTTVTVNVSDYQSFKLGGQVITISYGESTMQQMVYVYDDSNVILTEIRLDGLKLGADGNADLTEGKIIFVSCDGSERKADMAGYMDSITVEGATVTFKYNSIIDNVKYPFVVTEVARAAQN